MIQVAMLDQIAEVLLQCVSTNASQLSMVAAQRKAESHSGIYRIRPVLSGKVANMDAWIVDIYPVCGDYPRKTDACKDRT
jgi:hypothetical protein